MKKTIVESVKIMAVVAFVALGIASCKDEPKEVAYLPQTSWSGTLSVGSETGGAPDLVNIGVTFYTDSTGAYKLLEPIPQRFLNFDSHRSFEYKRNHHHIWVYGGEMTVLAGNWLIVSEASKNLFMKMNPEDLSMPIELKLHKTIGN